MTGCRKAALGGAALPEITGFVGNEGAVSVADCNRIVSQGPLGSACRHCGFLGPHQQGTGAGPHYAWLLCGACGRWVHWLPKPRPVVQEGRS
jgi:hypothetical protein